MERGVVFGLKCLELLGSYDQSGFLLRMSQTSLITEELEYCKTLPKSGMMQNGKLYRQEMLEQDISEKDSGSSHTQEKFPTPTATNTMAEQSERVERNQSGGYLLRKNTNLT